MTRPAGATEAYRDGSPYRLAWLYLLVVAALVGVGISAGDLFFLADRSLSMPWALALNACDRAFAVTTANPAPPGFTDCMADPARHRGFVMLGAVCVVLAGAAALLLLVPSVDLWRLRRHRGRFTVPGAAARFATFCDDNELFGRNRPRLLIAGPPVRQAFTIGVIGRRPIVVLPAAVAVAYRDPVRFDPVVQHELAHVRARDVTWVAAVRGLVWLPVPAVAVGVLLEVGSIGPNAIIGGALLRALLLAGLVAVLAAALLRVREREADLHAARTGQAEALTALLRDASVRQAPAGNRGTAALRRLFARHPSPPERVRSLRHPDGQRNGDLAQGIALGAVTVATMVAVHDLTRELHFSAQGWLPALVDVWVGAGLLAGGLMPSLIRRAESARRTGVPVRWWRPITGTAIGLFAVAFGTAWFQLPGGLGFYLHPGTAGSLLRGVATAALGVGAVGLCVILAMALVDVEPSAGPMDIRWRYAGYATAISATAAVLWPLPVLASVLTDPVALRAWLVYVLPRTAWLLPALALPVLIALRSRPAGPGTLRRVARSVEARVVALVVLVCGGGAVLHTQLNPPATLDEAVRAAQARWLLCALAGMVVLLVTATKPGPRSLARSVLAAGAATGLTAGLQYTHAAAAGLSADALAFRLSVGTPLVWLLYLAALSSPVLLLRPVHDVRPTRMALPAMVPTAAVLTVVVLGPGVPGSYAPLPGTAGSAAVPSAPTRLGADRPAPGGQAVTAGPATTSPPAVGAIPAGGRRLTTAEARGAAQAARPALPKSWVPREIVAGGEARIEPATCRPLARDAYLDVLKPGIRARAEAGYGTPRSQVGIVSTTMDVTVTSYAEPVPDAMFAAADAARGACRQFTGGSGPVVRFTVGAKPAPLLGEQSWRVDYALSSGSGRNRITGTTAFVLVRVGHNLVTVAVTAVMEPLDERTVTGALTAVVRALDQP
ncbi:M48 family metalloprotease [Micromonospora sp. NPDC050200]|uniref:M48 family metalloprotease n=1 Tax=Micromonospora sp. NPDC050200 TaxID=3155664 RepID=UPI0033F29780